MQQRANDLFGVVRVHLAPEGFDVERFFHSLNCSDWAAICPYIGLLRDIAVSKR